MSVMRVDCLCGKSKPHGQMCWIRTEIEIPLPNNDEHFIETETLQREIAVCRSCLKKIVNERAQDKEDGDGATLLLDYLRRRLPMNEHIDEDAPEVMDAVARLAIELQQEKLVNS